MENKLKNLKHRRKIRQGDKVIAISGASRGLTGTVLSCNGEKVIVQGLNFRKKHVKRSEQNRNGGTIELEAPIHISNLRVCLEDGKPVKLRVRRDGEGNRELYFMDGDKAVTYRNIKQKQ